VVSTVVCDVQWSAPSSIPHFDDAHSWCKEFQANLPSLSLTFWRASMNVPPFSRTVVNQFADTFRSHIFKILPKLRHQKHVTQKAVPFLRNELKLPFSCNGEIIAVVPRALGSGWRNDGQRPTIFSTFGCGFSLSLMDHSW